MSIPAWQATHVYVLGTRVTPVTVNGTVWLVETAGTSAGTEPTWPIVQPWTVVDGTVTWGRASSFRQNFVSGIGTVIDAFITANPTMLKAYLPARPKSGVSQSTPYAYLSDRPETITHAHDIRTRTISATVALVDVIPDNEEALARMDSLIDGLVDTFTLNFHAAGAPSITVEEATAQVSDQEPGASLYEEILTISGTLTEGRG